VRSFDVDRSPPTSSRRERVGWYFYDWANSAFYTTVVTVFLGPYLTNITKAASDSAGFVYPLGIQVRAGSFFPYIVSLSVALQVLLLPVLGAIADYSHRKKELLAGFAYLGAAATAGMYFLRGTNYLWAEGCSSWRTWRSAHPSSFTTRSSGPLSPDERDAVSSTGWAVGYLGAAAPGDEPALFSFARSLGITPGKRSGSACARRACGGRSSRSSRSPRCTTGNRQAASGRGGLASGFRQLRARSGAPGIIRGRSCSLGRTSFTATASKP
jgi:hypothetical protein